MRYLLKLSGEALADEARHYDDDVIRSIAGQVKDILEDKNEVGIVIGGGNYWRGRSADPDFDRSKADQIGMLATVMNCIYVAEIFRQCGCRTRIFTPFACGGFTELYSKDLADRSLSKKKVVFFAGGTGHPYFSTDTGVVLRAVEMKADAILLAKNVDGVYDSDPRINPRAQKYSRISYDEVLAKNLQVMDLTACIMARDNQVPSYVFDLKEDHSIIKAKKLLSDGLKGDEFSGTYVS